MVNRLELADHFIQAQLAKRADIIGAWVGGSTAREEATEASDIDVALVIAGDSGQRFGARAGVETWQDGIYYDAVYLSASEFADLETVMQNPFWATHMNDGLLRYDPTGHFTQLQQAVRAVYMQPQWLGKRLAFWLDIIRTSLARFREALTVGDRLEICAAFGWFTFGCASIPLLHAGRTPSSTRTLLMLGHIAPTLKAHLAELEGSTQMSQADVLALEPLLEAMIPLDDSGDQLLIYFIKKTLWMAQQGQYQEALHTMWFMMSGAAENCLQCTDPAGRATGIDLAHRWLQRTHFEGAAVRAAKLQQAEMLLRQVEVLVEESDRR